MADLVFYAEGPHVEDGDSEARLVDPKQKATKAKAKDREEHRESLLPCVRVCEVPDGPDPRSSLVARGQKFMNMLIKFSAPYCDGTYYMLDLSRITYSHSP